VIPCGPANTACPAIVAPASKVSDEGFGSDAIVVEPEALEDPIMDTRLEMEVRFEPVVDVELLGAW
jgi:hypothetical protein